MKKRLARGGVAPLLLCLLVVVATVGLATVSYGAEAAYAGTDEAVAEPELSVTQTVSVSDNLKNVLTVEVENESEYLTYTYQWYKDGEAIEGETSASLLVDDDDASYSVTVTATAGDVSASATYEVDHVHTYVWSRWGGWTVDEDGNPSNTAYAKCSSCDDEQDVEELTEGGRTVTLITYSSTDATCTEDATVTYKARVVFPAKTQTSAAYTVTQTGTATGHDYEWGYWGEWSLDEDGTPTVTAYVVCANCGDEQVAGETRYTVATLEAATCTQQEVLRYAAYVLPSTGGLKYNLTRYDVTGDYGDHSYEVTEQVDATCEEDGYTVYTCSVCGDSYTETVEATGHDYEWGYWGEWSLDEDGTPTVTAYVVCANCGDEQVAGETRYTVATLEAATCTQQEVLRYAAYVLPSTGGLKYNLTRYDVTGDYGDHSYEVTEQVDATCEEDGYTVYTCSVCGDSYTETVEATGHSWDEGEVTVEATATTDGVLTYTCSVCGATYTEVIPATGEGDDGDDADTDDADDADEDDADADADEDDADADADDDADAAAGNAGNGAAGGSSQASGQQFAQTGDNASVLAAGASIAAMAALAAGVYALRRRWAA